MAFNAPLGPPTIGASPDTLAAFPSGFELDSCARAFATASRAVRLRSRTCLRIFGPWFTSILRQTQNCGKIFGEARSRQNFIASRRLCLTGKLGLHMR